MIEYRNNREVITHGGTHPAVAESEKPVVLSRDSEEAKKVIKTMTKKRVLKVINFDGMAVTRAKKRDYRKRG